MLFGWQIGKSERRQRLPPERVETQHELERYLDTVCDWCIKNGATEEVQPAAPSAKQLLGMTPPPPRAGETFLPGEVVLFGRTISLDGKRWELLKLLVESNGKAVHAEKLIDSIWPDNPIEPETLRTHISNLRTVLRKAFNLTKASDPIPHCDTGPRKGWRLAVELFE